MSEDIRVLKLGRCTGTVRAIMHRGGNCLIRLKRIL
jgi:hypothetical protein